ncbi:MAG: LysM domain-containing protein [Proteobacteria bacterium]|nr:LysM domain-containing protein [Pseudomonadota bacterium]
MTKTTKISLGLTLIASASVALAGNTYTIKQGDSLSKIAEKQIINRSDYVDCLKTVNHISDVNRIRVGEEISLPSIEQCKALLSNMHYQLCSGNAPYQNCQTFDNKAQCVDKLKQCQNAPNQVKPWLCGSCHAAEMVGGKGSLPPAYLSVKGFKDCLDTQKMGGWTAYCLPDNKPQSCTDGSWSKLSTMTIPKCHQ